MGAGVFHNDTAVLQHIAVIRCIERHVGVLLDQQNSGAALAVDAHHDLENFLSQLGAQAQTWLVEQDQVWVRHQGPRDGQHLLLSARQQASILRCSFFQNGEVAIHRLHVTRHAVAVRAGVGTHEQVVVYREQRKNFAPLGHMAQALLHDKGRIFGGDGFTFELDRTFAWIDDPRNGFKNSGLASAVGAQHRGNFAAADLQADTANGLDGAIRTLYVEQFEDGQVADGGRHRAHGVCASTLVAPRTALPPEGTLAPRGGPSALKFLLRDDTSSIEPR